jgi:tripartite ATP-independent transporter DctM subunit
METLAGVAEVEAAAAGWPERVLARVVEAAACIGVLAEVVILSAGVIARYVVNDPLVWSDELASIVFLWLAMLGSVIALQRGEHMRLTTAVGMLPKATRPWAAVLAVLGPTVFLGLILWPAMDYAIGQVVVETPALGWPDAVRAGAIASGFMLMLLDCLLRLRGHRLRHILGVAAVLAVLAAVAVAAAPELQAIGNWNLIIFFVLVLGTGVLSGVPIAFAFGLSTVSYMLLITDNPLSVIVGRMDEGMSSLILLAVPMFVLLGQLIEMTGMARAMVNFLAAMLGHVRGGLSYVLIGAVLLVSGISGSKAADLAAVAPVLFPEMRRRGAEDGELVSLLAATGAMSETIPPSLVLITIGSVTTVSIAALFRGGLLPGVVLAIVLAVVARWRSPPGMVAPTRAPAVVMGRTFIIAVPALILPFVIRAAVIDGVTTATEVSTVGIAYALLMGLCVYRRFDWRRIYPILVHTAALSGAILLIIGSATGMAWALTQSGFSAAMTQAMAHVPGGRYGFMAISIVAFTILGSVLEGLPSMVLFAPLLFPVAQQLGISQVHYAMVAMLAMGIGLFAPPFGLMYYASCTISGIHPDAGMRRIWPYLGAVAVGLLIVAAVPWISVGSP